MNKMLASQIICVACGYHGSLDTQAVSIENSRSDCFKCLGNDFFTGAMYYQCPECNSYLNVDPMDILKMDPARGQPNPGHPAKYPYSVWADTDFLRQLPGMIKDGMLGLTRYISKNLGLIFIEYSIPMIPLLHQHMDRTAGR